METNEPLESFIRMLRATKRLESRRLERAFRAAPRHWFVDRMHAHSKRPRFIDVNRSRPTRRHLERIYSDEALVTHRDPPSSTSQPSLVAFMLEALDVRAGARVLEIGAGTGWNAALMAHLVGPSGSVVSVDIQADVARCARRHIKRAGVANVTVATGDGAVGMITVRNRRSGRYAQAEGKTDAYYEIRDFYELRTILQEEFGISVT